MPIKSPLPCYKPDIAFMFQISVAEEDKSFTLPLTDVLPGHNFVVDWGDSNSNEITSYDDVDKIHNYLSAGTYNIRITGTCSGFQVQFSEPDCYKIIKIIKWGDVHFKLLDFGGCTNLISIPNESGRLTEVTSFCDMFDNCTALTNLPSGLFAGNTLATDFSYCFSSCSFTSIPTELFKDNTQILNLEACFLDCENLESIPENLFKYNTLVTNFASCFALCYALTDIPTNLFKYNTLVTNFASCFSSCSFTSIPTELFKYNTNNETFEACFYNCGSIETLPIDLFRYNTLVTTFKQCFELCSNLESVPTNLFKYNIAALDFSYCLKTNTKLQLNANIFYANGEQSTRFLNQAINFRYCFGRTSFTGVQGIAPDLWNCNFGTETPTKDYCFNGDGNSLTSISNYNDIPIEWK